MAAHNRKRKRILYVEDNEDAREVVALNLAGYKLVCGRNFEEGLRLSRRSQAVCGSINSKTSSITACFYTHVSHGFCAPTYDRIEKRSLSVESHYSMILHRRGKMANLKREKKLVLLVEDEEDARDLVAIILAEYKLICASDFDYGLSLARQRYFDLYILDNWLPSGSGIGLCRRIREFDPHTPILFYSAAAYQRDIEEALRSGAQAYLVKPVKLDDLSEAVARLTSPKSSRDFAAWRAELAAVREELAIQNMENAGLFESSKEKLLRAKEKLMRLKAEKAFLDAGGTRGEFARRWPSVLVEEVRSHGDGE